MLPLLPLKRKNGGKKRSLSEFAFKTTREFVWRQRASFDWSGSASQFLMMISLVTMRTYMSEVQEILSHNAGRVCLVRYVAKMHLAMTITLLTLMATMVCM